MVCGSIVCAGACVVAAPLLTPELAALVDAESPAVVAREGTCCTVTPAVLEKKDAPPDCMRGTS